MDSLAELFIDYVDKTSSVRALVFAIVFMLGFALYMAMAKTDIIQKSFVWADGVIQSGRSKIGFDWASKKIRMIEQGLEFYEPKYLLPHYYLLMHGVWMVVGFAIGMIVFESLFISVILALAMIFFLPYYFGHRDKKDNEAMIPDIMTISSALNIQVQGGEYLGIALAECKDIVYHKRLKQALQDFDAHLKMNDLTLVENLNEFGAKFTSNEILALVTIMKQGIETGRMMDCAADLNKQCLTVREVGFDGKKAHLDRLITIGMLLVFADGLVFILWRFFENMFANFSL